MRPIPIQGCTRRIGAPQGWDHEKMGICHTIEVLDSDGWMITAWMPKPEELERLNNGFPILLCIMGTRHPVVGLTIGGVDVPKNSAS